MKERGILFSGEMVRAILDGRKTQTRRVVLAQPRAEFCDLKGDIAQWANQWGGCYDEVRCPFGKPGDRLWVRETFYCDDYRYPGVPLDERGEDMREFLYYRADGEWHEQIEEGGRSEWKPCIHMPRWASRIMLEVIGVRVERVQQITPTDAAAEAADDVILNPNHPLRPAAYERGQTIRGERYAGIIQGYAALWDSLNAKRGYGWDLNPWVWVIEFRRVEEQRAAA